MMVKFMVNAITVSRVILTILLTHYIRKDEANILILMLLFMIIYLSDYLDGKLARRFLVCSRLGAIMDVSADFFFILSVSIALTIAGSFPFWILIVIIAKFLEFIGTSYMIRRYDCNTSQVFLFDSLGRKVAVLFYLLPGLAFFLTLFLSKDITFHIMNLFSLPIGIAAFISCAQRIRALMRRTLAYHI